MYSQFGYLPLEAIPLPPRGRSWIHLGMYISFCRAHKSKAALPLSTPALQPGEAQVSGQQLYVLERKKNGN